MISSAMLPNVALRMPPTCGPVSAPRRSVERPTIQARPRIATADTTNTAEPSTWRPKSSTIATPRQDERDEDRDPRDERQGAEHGDAAGAGGGRGQVWAMPRIYPAGAARRRASVRGIPVAAATRRAASPRATPPATSALDLGPRGLQRVVRGVRPRGIARGSPRPQPTTMTISPRAGIVPSAACAARSPSGPRAICSWSFVSSRQTAPGRSSPQASARSRSVAASRVGASNRTLPRSSSAIARQPLPPLPPDRGEEPLERPARPRDARPGDRRQHRRRARAPARPTPPCRGPRGDEPLARVGHDGRPGVGHEREVRAAPRGASSSSRSRAGPLCAW